MNKIYKKITGTTIGFLTSCCIVSASIGLCGCKNKVIEITTMEGMRKYWQNNSSQLPSADFSTCNIDDANMINFMDSNLTPQNFINGLLWAVTETWTENFDDLYKNWTITIKNTSLWFSWYHQSQFYRVQSLKITKEINGKWWHIIYLGFPDPDDYDPINHHVYNFSNAYISHCLSQLSDHLDDWGDFIYFKNTGDFSDEQQVYVNLSLLDMQNIKLPEI